MNLLPKTSVNNDLSRYQVRNAGVGDSDLPGGQGSIEIGILFKIIWYSLSG